MTTRVLRFTIRDLFWLMLVIAMGLGWLNTANHVRDINQIDAALKIETKRAHLLEDYIVGDLGGNVLWRGGGDNRECVWVAIEMHGEQGVTGLCTDPVEEPGSRRGIRPNRSNRKPWPIPYTPGSYPLNSSVKIIKKP
jgi:hypothetical protein